jgi:hypothetical protein
MMMDYRKPSKEKANEEFLRRNGIEKGKAYREERLEVNKTFLIVCEGENTEPSYFKSFPVPSNTVVILGGQNSKNALVDYALKIRDSENYSGREVWCVFDYDVHPEQGATQPNDFNSAIDKAEKNGLQVAWSNDAFELWFVLHYQKLDTPLSRHELYPILKEKWEIESFHNEAKTDAFCEGHYKRHGGSRSNMQQLAIRRAKQLHQSYNGARNFADQCPCTTVYLLVEELNKFVKR